jgi:hypothetical protein
VIARVRELIAELEVEIAHDIPEHLQTAPENERSCGVGITDRLNPADSPSSRPEPRISTRVERDGVTTMLGFGESYRPNRPESRGRTPPRTDTFRSDRERSPRRPRSPPATDSYHPNSRDRSPRRRSPIRRSPPRDSWRTRSPPRARSPPRRFSPRREDDRRERARSPRNDRYKVQNTYPNSAADSV